MASFEFEALPLGGLFVAQRHRREDDRGFLSRLFCGDEFRAAGMIAPIAQINQTLTRRRGTVRGMHFQRPPHAELKVVSCLRGEIFDVAVDVRRGSPTFLRWHAERLSPVNQRALVIPQGFAHGFQALTDDCEILYLHTEAYAAGAEDALNAIDPRLGISWPLPVAERSARDAGHALLPPDYEGLIL